MLFAAKHNQNVMGKDQPNFEPLHTLHHQLILSFLQWYHIKEGVVDKPAV